MDPKKTSALIAPWRRGAWLLRVLVIFSSVVLSIREAAGADFTDNFADRQLVTSLSGQLLGNNANATREVNEPQIGGKPGSNSVWISWIAPDDGIATFDTSGSSFDTLLSAFFFGLPTDTTLDKLHELARSDDGRGIAPASLMQFGVAAGHRYEIAVDGFDGASGDIVLNWSFISANNPPPILVSLPNDQAARQGDSLTLTVGIQTSSSLKMNWRLNGEDLAVETPTLVIPSLQPTNLGLYTVKIHASGSGSSPAFETAPVEIQINSEGQTNSLARDKLFDSLDNELHGDDGSGGAASLAPRLKTYPIAAAALSTGLTRGYDGSQIFNTTSATTDPNEPLHCATSRSGTYWWTYQPPADGTVTLDTIGST